MRFRAPEHFSLLRKFFWNVDFTVDELLYRLMLPKASGLDPVFRIPGLSFPTELHLLFTAARNVPGPGHVVEIGSYKGRSTAALAAGCLGRNDRKVFAVDPLPPEGQAVFLKNLGDLGLLDRVNPLFSKSAEAAASWKEPISVLFIDGDHSYESVRQDLEHWRSHVCPHGLIIFHDSDLPGVRRLLGELKAEGEFHFQGAIASVSFFSRDSVTGFDMTPFRRIQTFRERAAAFSNGLKRLVAIDPQRW